jgi:hypothetical protein
MEALFDRILTLNLIATTAVFYVAAKIYLLPRLDRLPASSVVIPILLLHSLRHLGLMFLTRGATYPGLSREFAWPTAIGDLVAALLAFISFWRFCATGREHARCCGFSTSGERWTCSSQLRRQPFIERPHSWDRLTGFQHSGFPPFW